MPTASRGTIRRRGRNGPDRKAPTNGADDERTAGSSSAAPFNGGRTTRGNDPDQGHIRAKTAEALSAQASALGSIGSASKRCGQALASEEKAHNCGSKNGNSGWDNFFREYQRRW